MLILPPVRAAHTYTQHLAAPPEAVFPLLCPVREAEWIREWAPTRVISASGVAERDCVFVTADDEDDADGDEAVWYVTRHEPASGFVEMLKITPAVTAYRLTIQLRPADEGCTAEIGYQHTSLGPRGDAFVAEFTAEAYRSFMTEWEERLNHYLRHGSAL